MTIVMYTTLYIYIYIYAYIAMYTLLSFIHILGNVLFFNTTTVLILFLD